MNIILASASPRRKELLARMGLEFEILPSRGEEIITKENPTDVVTELAKQKAAAAEEELLKQNRYSGTGKDFLIIGADTIVVNDGRILGKPYDAEDACRMLRSLSGKTHQVYTGVCLIYSAENISGAADAHGGLCRESDISQGERLFSERTDVTFYPMFEEEIRSYVATGDPMDKAGAYGIQGACGKYIKGIEGDYNNVVGLPIARLYQEMKTLPCFR